MRAFAWVCALLMFASRMPAETEFGYKIARTLNDVGRVDALAFCTGDTTAFAGSEDGSMYLIKVNDGTSRRVASGKHAVEAVDCSRDGTIGAGAAADGTIWLSRGGAAAQAIGYKGGHKGRITSLKFSPRGEFLVSAGHDKSIIVWDPTSGQKLFTLPNPTKDPITLAGFSATGSLLGIGENEDVVEWDLKSRNILRQSKESNEGVRDGRLSLFSSTVSLDGAYFVINKEVTQLPKGLLGAGSGLSPHPIGLGGGSGSGLSGAGLPSANSAAGPMSGGRTDPSGLFRLDVIRVFGMPGLTVRKPISGVNGQMIGMSISADNRFLAGALRREKLTFLSVYDLQEGIERASLPMFDGSKVAEFSRDGSWLAMVSQSGSLQILSVEGVLQGPGACIGCGPIRTTGPTTPLIAADRKIAVAVVDLQPLQVTPDLASAVTEMLRTGISEAGNLTIVDRQKTQDLMREQGFQYSDLADPATAVKLGKMLGVSNMLYGSLSKVGSKFTITVHMTDVQTGAIPGYRGVECECPEQDLSKAVALLRGFVVAIKR